MREGRKDLLLEVPTERVHGEIVVVTLADSGLLLKTDERIKPVRSVEFFIFPPIARKSATRPTIESIGCCAKDFELSF